MLDPSKRFLTITLILGIVVLVSAIAIGERAGDRVIGQVTEKRLQSVAPVTVTPQPSEPSVVPYGPNWKRTDVMAATGDPGFPDPRVPPAPLPTPPPPPKFVAPKLVRTPTPTPVPTPTPNLNIPIWRRGPFSTATPRATGSPSPSPSGSAAPAPAQSASPQP